MSRLQRNQFRRLPIVAIIKKGDRPLYVGDLIGETVPLHECGRAVWESGYPDVVRRKSLPPKRKGAKGKTAKEAP